MLESGLTTRLSPERIATARDDLLILERKAGLTEKESVAIHGQGSPSTKRKGHEKTEESRTKSKALKHRQSK